MSESHAPYVDDEPTVITRIDRPEVTRAAAEDRTVVTRASGPPLRILALPAPDDDVEDGDATVVETVAPPPGESAAPPPAPPAPRTNLYELFAEPPRIDEAPEESLADRKARRRKLLLTFAAIAGAWLVLRPWLQPPPPPPSEVLSIEPAAARVEPGPSLALPEPAEPVSVDEAAAHLSAGRYEEALPLYRALAADSPDDEAYQAIVSVLTREVVERCRARTSSACSR